MALYDYEIAIVADATGEPLSTTLVEAKLLTSTERPDQGELFGLGLFVDEHEFEMAGLRLRSCRLLFDPDFEAFAHARFQELVDWLWNVASTVRPLTMFIPSGTDARPSASGDPGSFMDLPRLLADGVPTVAHPIVYFGEALADGALCRSRDEVAYYHVERRPGIGCLYLSVTRSDAGTEIIESGHLQREMLAQLPSARR
jgi:hypothetical protein